MKDKTIKQIIPMTPSTIETIDFAMYEWLNNDMNLYCKTNNGWKKTPVKWVIGERSHISKDDRDFRDKDGALILPIITLERTSVTKDPTRKGSFWANIPPVDDVKGGSITMARRVQQEKTSNYMNASSKKRFGQLNYKTTPAKPPVYEYISIPMPVYVDVTYSITIRTEYQQQVNELVQPFMTRTGGINHFIIKYDEHEYEGFIQSEFAQENSVAAMGEDERSFKTTVEIKILGKLIGDGANQIKPQTVIRESAVATVTVVEIVNTEDNLNEAVEGFMKNQEPIKS